MRDSKLSLNHSGKGRRHGPFVQSLIIRGIKDWTKGPWRLPFPEWLNESFESRMMLRTIRVQICRSWDWLWSVNRGLNPIGINQRRGTVAKVNWNSQLLSNQPGIIALILVVPIDD